MDEYVVDCCYKLLLEGFNETNMDYLMYAMTTLKALIKSVQDRFFAFQRLSDIFDILIKIGRSEHMESEASSYHLHSVHSHHHTQSTGLSARSESYSSPFVSNGKNHVINLNGFTGKFGIRASTDVENRATQNASDSEEMLLSRSLWYRENHYIPRIGYIEIICGIFESTNCGNQLHRIDVSLYLQSLHQIIQNITISAVITRTRGHLQNYHQFHEHAEYFGATTRDHRRSQW